MVGGEEEDPEFGVYPPVSRIEVSAPEDTRNTTILMLPTLAGMASTRTIRAHRFRLGAGSLEDDIAGGGSLENDIVGNLGGNEDDCLVHAVPAGRQSTC